MLKRNKVVLDKSICSFEAGLINGAINNIYNKECETIELKCCALGDQYCLFKTKLQ